MDTSERNLVIVEHRVDGGIPACFASLDEGHDSRFVMKGRKGLRYNICGGSSEFGTWSVGKRGLVGGFHAELGLPDDGRWDEHQVRFADFDERTGRILIGTNLCEMYKQDEAIRIYLADLPP